MKVERRKIAELKSDPANARKHSPRNLKAIRDSLDVFEQQKPIVVDSRGVVIAGNGTLEAARELGWEEIAVVVTDLDPAHAQAFGIADNRTAELAEWDTDVLGQLLEGMDSDLADILSIDDLELPDSIDGGEQVEGLTDPDEVPEPPEEPITQTGDLWLLGEHRLLCGDSTSAEDVGRLMDGQRAEMCFTDPPYGVNYEGGHFHSGDVNIKNKREKIVADESASIYTKFLPIVIPIIDGPCYIWFADSKAREVYNSVHQSGCEVHALIIWHKTNTTYAAMNAQYKKRHESCLYFKPKGSTLRWRGKTTEATVWNQDRDGINDLHPTQKPVALALKAIGNHDAKNVLDCFSGSGSTLIAAEQLGRKCYGMEIDPKYCDVIVKRWEEFTGQTANRENERT
ncbi:MAG: site-specific DNA-methyltransferase [Candidatus Latescibacterota bacterium]